MYVIETELGRFQADDEKAAKKLLRAAAKEKRKLDAETEEKRKIALSEAYHNGYRIYDFKMSGQEFPPGWRILPVSETSYPCRKVGEITYAIDSGNGPATFEVYDGVSHYLENGAGFALAVCILKQDAELYAFGSHDGVGAIVPVNGVKISEFLEPKATRTGKRKETAA